MKERLEKLLAEKGLTAARFAEKIGVQRSNMSHVLSGRNNPSYDFIQKILMHYPEINPEWLILGRGEMYQTSASYNNHEQTHPKDFDLSSTAGDVFSAASPQTDPANHQGFESGASTDAPGEQSPEGKDKQNLSKEEDRDQKVNMSRSDTPQFHPAIERIVIFYTDKTFVEYSPGSFSGNESY